MIPVKIINNGRTIVGMKYEVRSTEDSRLIDNGEAKHTENTEKTTLYEINASAILQSGQEYQLVLTLETNNNEKVHTTIVSDTLYVSSTPSALLAFT